VSTERHLQGVFISYASSDRDRYIQPLVNALRERNVTFWLDFAEIGWGDNISAKLNAGLRSSRYVLVCLSAEFLKRPWPEQELSAALSLQNADDTRVLPLILNARDEVLQFYPLIAGMAYREYELGVAMIADDIAALTGSRHKNTRGLRVLVESIHTGVAASLSLTPKHSVAWLAAKATASLGLRTEADTGGFQKFPLRWVLVDVRAEAAFKQMTPVDRESLHAIVMTGRRGETVSVCKDPLTTAKELGLRSNTTFHLYAVPVGPRVQVAGFTRLGS